METAITATHAMASLIHARRYMIFTPFSVKPTLGDQLTLDNDVHGTLTLPKRSGNALKETASRGSQAGSGDHAKRPSLRAFSMHERRAQGYRELGRSHQKSEGVHHRKMKLRYSITDPPGGCQQFFTSVGLGRTTKVVVMRRTRVSTVELSRNGYRWC